MAYGQGLEWGGRTDCSRWGVCVVSGSVVFNSFVTSMDCGLPGSSVHGISRGNIVVVCHFLLQGIFLTQG